MIRALWVATELLHPVNKGGRIRTYNTLKWLKSHQHVTYLTLDDGSADPDAIERAQEYAHEVIAVPHKLSPKFGVGFYVDLLMNLASPEPYAVAKYRSARLQSECRRLLRERRPDLLVCDFLAASVNLPESIGCPSVLFQHNVEAMIWRRHCETEPGALRRTFLRRQWQKMARFEQDACRRFDQVIAVSTEDRDAMRREYGVEHVDDVPTGVDTEFFRPTGRLPTNPFELTFVGSMDWRPNEQGILRFVREVLPRVRKRFPETSLTVVGRSPPKSLLQLAAADRKLTVTGRVDDVRPYIERAAVCVVPLYVGGGTRIKIYEAMAMGKAVVATSIGAEGLPVQHDRHVFIADGDERFAEAIGRLLADPDRAAALGARAAEYVRSSFGWETVARRFADICEATATGRPIQQSRAALAPS